MPRWTLRDTKGRFTKRAAPTAVMGVDTEIRDFNFTNTTLYYANTTAAVSTTPALTMSSILTVATAFNVQDGTRMQHVAADSSLATLWERSSRARSISTGAPHGSTAMRRLDAT